MKIIGSNGVIMRKKVWLVVFLLASVLICNLIPSANAIRFDVGKKIGETSPGDFIGYRMYYFDSGCCVYTSPDTIDFVPLIFDGNPNTGLDYNSSGKFNVMTFHIYFPCEFYVTNITVKSIFNGSSSSHRFGFGIQGGSYTISMWETGEKFVNINHSINSISLDLKSNGTYQFNFNDIIFDYTMSPKNFDEINNSIQILSNYITILQNQVKNLTNRFDILYNMMVRINNTVNNLNQTQQNIFTNITNLWSTYIQINETINNFENEIDNFNISIYQNITQLRNDLIMIKNDIYDIQQSLTNISLSGTTFPGLQDQINQTILDIKLLNENITEIKNTIFGYDTETPLKDRIFQLESKNTILREEVVHLELELENLTSEIDDLIIQTDELKTTEKEKIIEKQPDNSLVYGAIGLCIVGIILAITALVFKRRILPSTGAQPQMWPPIIQATVPIQSIQPSPPQPVDLEPIVPITSVQPPIAIAQTSAEIPTEQVQSQATPNAAPVTQGQEVEQPIQEQDSGG